MNGAGPPTSSLGIEELQRKPHEHEAVGLVCTAIQILSTRKLFLFQDEFLPFCLLCANHHDEELRNFGWIFLTQTISMVPSARWFKVDECLPAATNNSSFAGSSPKGDSTPLPTHPLHPRPLPDRISTFVHELLLRDDFGQKSHKDREKILLLVGGLALSNPGFWKPEDRERVWRAAENLLLDPKPNVRFAAKRLLAALFLMCDVDGELRGEILRYKKVGLAAQRAAQQRIAEQAGHQAAPSGGTTGKPGAVGGADPASVVVPVPPQVAVQALVAILLIASDLSAPRPLTGKVIEGIAVFGKGRFFEDKVVKEAQTAFQTFLKSQQASEVGWKECKKKLTEKQLELVEQNKGHLSYFS